MWQGQNRGNCPLEKDSVLIFNLFNIYCISLFLFFKKKFFVGRRHKYEHYFEQVSWLSNNQKPFAVIVW